MDDNSNVSANPDRPEVRVLGAFQLVKLQARMGGVQLEIERGGFDSFLLVTRQSGKAVCERVCDSEFHAYQLSKDRYVGAMY
jgi:hypothetical protein